MTGWALPIRSNFRFSYKQKNLLYNCFMEGEMSGKRISPEQAEEIIRQSLTPDEYVTTTQIKSMFLRWTKDYREGKLKKPIPDAVEDMHSNSDTDETINSKDIYIDNHYDVQNIIQTVSLCKNDWVVIKANNECYPGIVTQETESAIKWCQSQNYGMDYKCYN